MTEPSPTTGDADEPQGGIFREWVLPIVIGLAVGGGLVWGWKHRAELFASEAEKIVATWSREDWEATDAAAERLKKLPKEARADLLEAFRGIQVPENPDGEEEWKFWAASALIGEPFLDTRSLYAIVRDPGAPLWDRRAASAALVHGLKKDVDPTAVAPVLVEWAGDRSLLDRVLAVTSVQQLRADKLFGPEDEAKYEAAILPICDSVRSVKPVDEYDEMRLRNDRERAVNALAEATSQDAVRTKFWSISLDESDDVHVRAAALRTLAGSGVFDDIAPWKKASESADVVIRQIVAENLQSTQLPEYDAILSKLHADAGELVRAGSIDSQVRRNRPTPLSAMGRLVEDASPWVRFQALVACGHFKSWVEGIGERQGMAIRLLETSDDDFDLSGAILALHMMTGQSFGFDAGDLDVPNRHVKDAAIAAFKADPDGRREAVAKWRAHLGGGAVWSDASRRAALEELKSHADPENAKRAAAELAKFGK